jgi:D-alanyl-lipoteichoic acid acyltransferase DltB (MBOAT superfamily)
MLDYDSFLFFANLFLILIVLLPIYRLMRVVVVRRVLLTLVGAYLLWLIAPRLALFYVALWLVAFVLQRLVALTAEKRGGAVLFTAAIVLLLAPMVIWKLRTQQFVIDFNLWGNDALMALSRREGAVDLAREIILPLGLSFSTFRALDMLIKTYIGVFEGLRLDEVLFYGFFPPVLLIGPVIQYTGIQHAVEPGRTVVWEDLRAALLLVVSGLVKVFVISYPLQSSAQMFLYYRTNPTSTLWIELVLFALYFFFNFSGYSDLAIGGARILGFDIERNFNWPYIKTNPQDFWNSWHMSLTHFFQRNVFVPFGGMRESTQYRAIFLTIMAIAMWHDISIPLLVFGLYHAVGLIGHRWLRGRRPPPDPQPRPLTVAKAAGQFMFVTLSLPLMAISTDQIVPVYSALFGR